MDRDGAGVDRDCVGVTVVVRVAVTTTTLAAEPCAAGALAGDGAADAMVVGVIVGAAAVVIAVVGICLMPATRANETIRPRWVN
jgi:hypothetical protein